jgi:hypothetical protein
MEVSGRHARTRAIIGDTISPADWVLQATKMRRETSRVSFLMCRFVSAGCCSDEQHRFELQTELGDAA